MRLLALFGLGVALATTGLSGLGRVAYGASPSPPEQSAPSVILISLDGTRPADVTADNLPSLLALGRRGAVADHLVPVTPSNTFPNHVTLVTGVSPAQHGIVSNIFRDPVKGIFKKKKIPDWIEVEPLWSVLADRGMASAAYHWVGSEGIWRNGRGPTYWKRFSKRTPESKKVKQILAWLDLSEDRGRPHFIASWFHGADHAGHYGGPGSAAVHRTLLEQDAALDALVRGIDSRGLFASTTLMVVSDHGMAGASRRVDLGAALRKAGVKAHVFGIGGFAIIDLDGRRADREANAVRAITVARALGLEAFDRSAPPPGLDFDHARFGDVIARAPIGTALVYRGLAPLRGFHGYDSTAREMAAIFLAAGRGVEAGSRLPAVRAIDVAPTVLALLGLPVPSWMEGRPIEALVPADTASATLATGGQKP